MADFGSYSRFLNPWMLHLQKMGLELKCPLCLNLLNRPILMPCNHIFCSSCVPRSTEFGSECPICKSPFVDQDIRSAPHMENMVSIYRSMDAAFSANLFHWVSQIDLPEAGRLSDRSRDTINTVDDDKLRKTPVETTRMGNWQSSTPSSIAKKRVHVSLHQSEVKAEKSIKSEKSSVPSDGGKEKKFGVCSGTGVSFRGEGSATSSLPRQFRDGRGEEGRIREMDLNQVAQTSPDSPPSFGDAKDSDDDSSVRGSKHSVEKFPAKGAIKKESENGTVTEMGRGPPTQVEEDLGRELKRKKLNYDHQDTVIKTGIHESIVLNSQNVLMSNSKSEPKLGVPVSDAQPSAASDCLGANSMAVCAFCQSSRLSELTGPMMHYVNGKEVAAYVGTQSNVLHVHSKCIEWAPQVYFDGDTVMNLEEELARGAKLKCCRCGLKGAALGCYAKSCRKTFHVPCAVEIDDCRWDCENFLVLCPTHSSVKFPNERSKSGKNIRACHSSATQVDCRQSIKSWAASPGMAKGWVLCGSALSVGEKNLLAKFARMTGATVSKMWESDVTHVIAATDEMGACSRTVKVLMAILYGRWVLKIDWIKACLEAMQPVEEEPYEVSRDIHGCRDGPKNGRLRILEKAPKLFGGLNFYFIGDFVPSYKECLEDLVLAAGGTVLQNRGRLVSQGCDEQAASTTYVVYNRDPPDNCNSGEEYLESRLKEAEDFANEIGSRVIGHTWLLESIAACKLQPPAC